ncbi:hypothetical protein PV396_14825 [Streptomyces sp. ME02-8801-2C]|uniref:hypothetical protein n=1 Tax=Streptomyces sp. ME02-8801-2C TaxID=3028680 RepID=UPI0029A90D96|nr:hypothetical protein [Streptomyces sp. ME02-8801-2C]MDX3453211.1 hypothetical protein [Streptomyces sp. ME02-8801-2C]
MDGGAVRTVDDTITAAMRLDVTGGVVDASAVRPVPSPTASTGTAAALPLGRRGHRAFGGR